MSNINNVTNLVYAEEQPDEVNAGTKLIGPKTSVAPNAMTRILVVDD